tara:strand:+ start:133 stop:267 length:135 start_codon:yes stop_codon:yes gene_type:complete
MISGRGERSGGDQRKEAHNKRREAGQEGAEQQVTFLCLCYILSG